jgi:hypothetical protein
MFNGKYVKGEIQLNGQPYSLQDVEKLINVLKNRYDLKCSLYIKKGICRIDISKESLKLLRTIVRPHILPSMLYKIGLSFPIATYDNVEDQKSTIYIENRNKSGVYR